MENILGKDVYGFKIIKLLGSGESGTAILGEMSNGKKIVIKLFNKYIDYLRELTCLQHLEERNMCGKEFVCRVHYDKNVKEENGEFFIVTEFAEKYITLEQFMNLLVKIDRNEYKKKQSEIYKRLDELDKELNKIGIMHNDLHEGNVLIHPDTLDLKIIDFGSCKTFPLAKDIKAQGFTLGEIARMNFEPEMLKLMGFDEDEIDEIMEFYLLM
jgi:serine/threonine protein kinase